MNVEPRIELKEVDKEHLVVEILNPKSLLHTNNGASILPGTNTSLSQDQEKMLPMEDPKKILHKHRFEDLDDFLSRYSKVYGARILKQLLRIDGYFDEKKVKHLTPCIERGSSLPRELLPRIKRTMHGPSWCIEQVLDLGSKVNPFQEGEENTKPNRH